MAKSEAAIEEEISTERGGYPYYSLPDPEAFIKEIHRAGGWEVSLETACERLYKTGSPRINNGGSTE